MLLPDVLRILGPDHRDTLITRGNLAFWWGETGDAARAMSEFEVLLADAPQVLGPDHPDPLADRWTHQRLRKRVNPLRFLRDSSK